MIELWDGARSEDWKSEVEPPGGEVNERLEKKAERDAGHKYKDKDKT